MFYSLKDKFARFRFDHACRKVLNTPPVPIKAAPLTILSMLNHRDLIMYLIALKSLYRQVGAGSVVVLNDGSLTTPDKDLLRSQIPGVVIREISEVERGVFPKGGCWERLLLILEYAQRGYVIQMDADTLSIGAINEVVQSYQAGRSFCLGTQMGQKIMTPEEIYDLLLNHVSSHVQVRAERRLRDLRNASSLRYIRGSAAFAGFAPGTVTRSFLQELSVQMQDMLGDAWSTWGTEQFSSNCLIANCPNAVVLPHPAYATFRPTLDISSTRFLHFNGTFRFQNDIYLQKAKSLISSLNSVRNI